MPFIMSAQSDLLADYQWKSRVILLFAPEESNANYKAQQEIIRSNKLEYEDRDLVVLSFILGNRKGQLVREEFNIKDKIFTYILIGKDGYEKLTTNKVVPSKDLFKLIDSMPMRIGEMKRKKK